MRAIFEVHKTLDPGFMESIYEKVLMVDNFRFLGTTSLGASAGETLSGGGLVDSATSFLNPIGK